VKSLEGVSSYPSHKTVKPFIRNFAITAAAGALTTLFLLVTLRGCRFGDEAEAVKRAKEHWKITDIGGSTYLCAITTEKTVVELRNFEIRMGLGPPSEVDKLNGVEYDGIANLCAAACRRYSPQSQSSGQPDKNWSDWSPPSGFNRQNTGGFPGAGVDQLRVRKVRGEWTVAQWRGRGYDKSLYYVPENATFKQVEASDLPK